MSTSEVIVIESMEVRELIRFLILPWHLEQTFADAVKTFKIHVCWMSQFSMSCKKKLGCMHACILHVVSANLTRKDIN